MTQKLRRHLAFFIAMLFLSISFVSVLTPTQTSAADINGSFIVDELVTNAKLKNKFLWLVSCYGNIDIDEVTQDQMDGWDFFERRYSGSGPQYSDLKDQLVGNIYGPGEKAVWSCFSGDNVRTAYESLGFDNPREAFCAIDNAYAIETDGNNDNIGDTTECITREMNGGDHWDMGGDLGEQAVQFIQSVKNADGRVTGSGSHPELFQDNLPHEQYTRLYISFMEQCGEESNDVEIIKDSFQPGDDSEPNMYNLIVVNKEGITHAVLAKGQSNSGSQVAIWADGGDTEYKSGGQGGDTGRDTWPAGLVLSCKEAAAKVNEYAFAYGGWLATHPNQPGSYDTNGDNNDGELPPSCWDNSGPLAWLLCPVLDLLDGAISLLDTWVNNLLFIDADTGYASQGVKDGNAVMRNIALLLLVPMMMFMVIGTALNFGPFDPYTVKKALPRMLVAVIFIVLSLPVCQFAVEVSNTIGQGVGNLILSATGSEIDSLSAIFAQHGDSATFAGLLLEGGAATIGVFTLTWGVVGSFALVTVIALLIAFVILVMRQVLVMMLIVLAPLAIIVWIFPGNDKLWGIWKGTFTAMLLLYPIIAILIASGRFVASVVGGG